MNAWSHLPNAKHIDRVLASVKSHPKLWYQARDQAWVQAWQPAWDQAKGRAWDQACEQARDQAWVQAWQPAWAQVGRAWVQVWQPARDQAWDQAWYQARDQAIRQVTGPLLALIAYDDSAKYLNLPIDQLKMLYHLTEHPACLLLQPAVLVFAKERELA
jgi:hypothetical protein